MAVRDDVAIDWFSSPRIITVLSPSQEIVIQDLVDTLRQAEDEPVNMTHDHLIDAAGKEELGGGVLVGITATLQNALLSFEARTTPVETGTATSADAGTVITDTTALFQTAGLTPGDYIMNHASGASATILEVTSETSMVTSQLAGGVRADWQIGDDYSSFIVYQCNVSGGNLVSVDDVGTTVDPIFTTFGTQVVRTSSSSATLQELEAIQYSSYAGGVWVDVTSAYSGTEFPVGTQQQPVNNMVDGEAILHERGFNNFYIIGDITLDTEDFTGHTFYGQGVAVSTITINSGANVLNCSFREATITGTLDGNSTIDACIVQSLNFVNGIIINSMLSEGYVITLGGANDGHFLDCYSGVPGTGTPTIDMGGSGQGLGIRGYNGGIELQNLTSNEDVSIDLNSGQVVLDSTISNGTIVCRGIGKLTDNSTGSATVISDNLIQTDNSVKIALIEKLLRNRVDTNPSSGQYIIYDDDSITPLYSVGMYEDVAGGQTYRGQGAERRDRLE